MNRSRRPITSVVAALAISGVTAFLLFRLSHRQTVPPAPSPPANSLLPTVLPVVDETMAPPVSWKAAVSGAAPSPQWKIAFERYDSDTCCTDIWTANGDGSQVRRILTDASGPCWSPQRRMLTFVRGGNVWVANANGTNARSLTFWPAPTNEEVFAIHGITWNPQNNMLTFSRDEVYRFIQPDSNDSTGLKGSTIYHLALKPTTSTQATQARPFAPYPERQEPGPDGWETEAARRRLPPNFNLTEDRGGFNFAENAFPAWSPSGTKLSFIRSGDVWLAEGEDWKTTQGYPQNWYVSRIAASARYDSHTVGSSRGTATANSISWAPDESWMVYGTNRINGSGVNGLHILRRRGQDWQDSLLKYEGDSPVFRPMAAGFSTLIEAHYTP